tara:strand:- start:984 stop:2045 length:1062 start_codon:yes stop_codon:yes gene_type:complete
MNSIIVTVGPKSIKKEVLEKLIKAGAERFRINLSHTNFTTLKEYYSVLKSVNINPSIDTQGAQLRITNLSKNLNINIGEKIELIFSNKSLGSSSSNAIFFNHAEAYNQIKVGDVMKVDFNGLSLRVIKDNNNQSLIGEVISKGAVSLNRAVDISGKSLELSVLTNFDKKALEFALSSGSKEVFASFISTKEQVLAIRKIIGNEVKLISKIETSLGYSNVEEIISFSDEILIDRGDLSREISIATLPFVVSKIISLANKVNKPVNLATNVLDSMMKTSMPSRAEISDIYNNLSLGVSGIVLAAEVAIGNNPVSSTALLKYIIDLYMHHKRGIGGFETLQKPSRDLIGYELYNWL